MGRASLGRAVLCGASGPILSWRCAILSTVYPCNTRHAGVQYPAYLDQREIVLALGLALRRGDRSYPLADHLDTYG